MGFKPTKFRNVAKNDMGEIGNLALLFFHNNSVNNVYDISDDSELIQYISDNKSVESYRYDDSHYVRYILYVYNNGVLNRHLKDGYMHHEKSSNLITLLDKGIKHLQTY